MAENSTTAECNSDFEGCSNEDKEIMSLYCLHWDIVKFLVIILILGMNRMIMP